MSQDNRFRTLATLRRAVRNGPPFPDVPSEPSQCYLPFVSVDGEPETLIATFRAALERLQGGVHVSPANDEALQKVEELVRAAGADHVLAWQDEALPLPGVSERLADAGVRVTNIQARGEARQAALQNAEPTQVCISGADYGLAATGTLVVYSRPGRGRLASLLAPVHIALLPVERLLPNAEAWVARLRQSDGLEAITQSSNVAFITGPSRTADIELSMTLGVHGPKEIHVILLTPPYSDPEVQEDAEQHGVEVAQQLGT